MTRATPGSLRGDLSQPPVSGGAALSLAGDDTDRRAARTTLSGKALATRAGWALAADASREQAVRQAEIRRLAEAPGQARRQLTGNRV
jgi:hypothetical protein